MRSPSSLVIRGPLVAGSPESSNPSRKQSKASDHRDSAVAFLDT